MPGIFDCEVVSQGKEADGVRLIMLNCPTIVHEAKPGQFVMVKASDGVGPLLRRPFSIHSLYPGIDAFSLVYAVRGKGTELLAKKRRSERVSVVGPLGKPFKLGEDPEARHILVCGGCGTVPMAFLCEALCKKWDTGRIVVLLGAKCDNAVLLRTEFMGYGVEVGIATEDGSCGHHGFVTQLLQEKLTLPADSIRVYACGPRDMLREVARISHEASVASCQVSLEKHMACGMGMCLGCVQKHRDASKPEGWEYRQVCTDGPVFEADGVIWE